MACVADERPAITEGRPIEVGEVCGTSKGLLTSSAGDLFTEPRNHVKRPHEVGLDVSPKVPELVAAAAHVDTREAVVRGPTEDQAARAHVVRRRRCWNAAPVRVVHEG